MKKRLGTLALAACMAVSMLAGCSASGGNSGTTTAAQQQKAEDTKTENDKTENTQAEESKTGDAAAPAKSDLKVALVLNGTKGDMAVMDSAANGIELAKQQLGIEGDVYEAGWERTKWESTMYDVCDSGKYDVVITGMFDMVDIVTKVSKEYPDIDFIQYDALVDYADGENTNVYSMQYKYNEGAFLAGYIAASSTESKKLGALGAMSVPAVNDFLLGYKAGIEYKDSAIPLQIKYADSFNDSTLGKELSLLMYNDGCDIVANCAAVSGLGVIDAAKEVGKKCISTDSDMAMAFKDTDPEKADTIIVSVQKRIDQSIVRALDLYIKGELPLGQGETLGMAEGTIELTKNEYYDKYVPQDLQKEVDEIAGKILSGEIQIPSAYELTIDEIKSTLGL